MKKIVTALATAGLLAGVFGFAAPKAAQASGVIWVSQKGTPVVDGSTSSIYASTHWDAGNYSRDGYDCNHPDYNDIQLAVDNSQDNDTIYICPGLWKMQESWQSQYGGYAQSAIVTDNPITDDGTTGLRFVGAGAKKTIIDGLTGGNRLDRGFNVYNSDSGDGLDATFVALTIQNFDRSGVYGDDISCDRATFKNNGTLNAWDGGAIYTDGNLETSGCAFINNAADDGGAIEVNEYWTDHGSTFSNNRADDDGGAAYVLNSVDLHGTIFTRNQSGGDGGALYVSAADEVFIDHVTATGNMSCSSCDGGAIYIDDYDQYVYVTSSVFKNNTAGGDGGAIMDYDDQWMYVTGSLFQGNRAAGDGGAIYSYYIEYSGNRFIGNVSGGCGGAVYFETEIRTPEANTYRGNSDDYGAPNWC